MEIALRARLNRTITIDWIALARIVHSRFYPSSIERISSKRNGQEEGETCKRRRWMAVSFGNRCPVFLNSRLGCTFLAASSISRCRFSLSLHRSSKAERFVWEIYRFFFFFKSFHLSIRLTIDNLSRERHPILRNNFKIRFFLFFFE